MGRRNSREISTLFAPGGLRRPRRFRALYPDEMLIKEKIEAIAKGVYLAREVSYEPLAERQIEAYEKAGLSDFPISMAKTHLSLSHDPGCKGAPTGFTVPVREVRASAAGGGAVSAAGLR